MVEFIRPSFVRLLKVDLYKADLDEGIYKF